MISYSLNLVGYPEESISEIEFTNNSTLLTVSIISMIMIAVGVIILFIAGFIGKRNIHYSKKFMTMTGFSAILLIVGAIVFWAGADFPTSENTGSFPSYMDVWDYFREGFGIFAPFIGGGISIIGISVHYVFFKFRIETPAKRKEVSLKINGFEEIVDKIYNLEKELKDKIGKLEETQKQILDQMVK